MILVSGEALIDMLPRDQGNTTLYLPAAGGAPFNIALALGRLGAPAAFLGRLSTDSFGELLARTLQESGVDLRFAPRTSALSTLGFVIFRDGQPSYQFYTQGTAGTALEVTDLPLPLPDAIRCLHFGSFALAQEPIASSLEALLRARSPRHLISVDPNVRPFLVQDRAAYEARLARFLSAAHVIKMSLEDLEWLHPGLSPAQCCDRYLGAGAKLVIVTLGGDGALAASPAARVQLPAAPVTVVDTIGAGDTFQAAALAWLGERHAWDPAAPPLDEAALRQLLAFAAKAAAINCSRPGCNPPWRRELTA